MAFVFVGERPSKRAVEIGATWQNGKLAGHTLRRALEAAGIDPALQDYINLYSKPEPDICDYAAEHAALITIKRAQGAGCVIVGMGRIVCEVLTRASVPHLELVHPAARGKIRKRERYHQHVAAVLLIPQGGN